MKIEHIKFLDPVVYTGKSYTKEEIEKLSSKIVEAAGYRIHEDDTNLYFANNTDGTNFKRVLCVNKNAVIQADVVTPSSLGSIGDIVEVKYIDTAQTPNGIPISKSSVQSNTQESIISVCGFLSHKDSENIFISFEKSQEGLHRTTTVIPKNLLV